ncbi:MAG: chemotaxis protein CheR [Betaproteobacteria bacterium]|nr:chemotaxis protein CheR [Betaproteobacteria bacterium]
MTTDSTTQRREVPRADGPGRAPNSTEFEYSDGDFERVRRIIYEEAGIKLGDSKRTMAYSRLVRRVRALGMHRFSDYLDLVEKHGESERKAFVNALTTNLTAFFREPHHFPILESYLAPRHARRPAVIWCAGCSTGEEAYSIAMTLSAASIAGGAHILATDVDTNVLETAERGVYALERIENLPHGYKERFFLEGIGRKAGQVMVRPEIKSLVTFRQVNLLESSWPLRAPLDAIFCRNVMIYFDKPTQYAVLDRFAELLEPGGLLFAGHSENFTQGRIPFRSRGRTVYERQLGRGSSPYAAGRG